VQDKHFSKCDCDPDYVPTMLERYTRSLVDPKCRRYKKIILLFKEISCYFFVRTNSTLPPPVALT
jgi:hypothetical protein